MRHYANEPVGNLLLISIEKNKNVSTHSLFVLNAKEIIYETIILTTD